MKVLDVVERNNYLVFVTDNPDRPEFAYRKDQFSDLNRYEKEIKKSIAFEKKVKDKIKEKVDKIKFDLSKPKTMEELDNA